MRTQKKCAHIPHGATGPRLRLLVLVLDTLRLLCFLAAIKSLSVSFVLRQCQNSILYDKIDCQVS